MQNEILHPVAQIHKPSRKFLGVNPGGGCRPLPCLPVFNAHAERVRSLLDSLNLLVILRYGAFQDGDAADDGEGLRCHALEPFKAKRAFVRRVFQRNAQFFRCIIKGLKTFFCRSGADKLLAHPLILFRDLADFAAFLHGFIKSGLQRRGGIGRLTKPLGPLDACVICRAPHVNGCGLHAVQPLLCGLHLRFKIPCFQQEADDEFTCVHGICSRGVGYGRPRR